MLGVALPFGFVTPTFIIEPKDPGNSTFPGPFHALPTPTKWLRLSKR